MNLNNLITSRTPELVLFMILLLLRACLAVEFTFELQERAIQCFYEVIKKGEKVLVEFQVVTGGHYDVDCKIEDPHGKTLYQITKKDYDQFQWTSEFDGEYKVCFSNEFSTISHKIVYLDWLIGDQPKLFPGSHSTALTALESSAQVTFDALNQIRDYQTHYRLREAQGRKFAEDLGERVMYWSFGQTLFLLFCGVGQVLVLRSFFAYRK